MKLVGDRVILRPFNLEDIHDHLRGEDVEQIKWVSGGKSTAENINDWIKKNQRCWENDGPIFNFAITLLDNTLIGMVEANSAHKSLAGVKEGDANISYAIYPNYRGKSYVVDAVNLMLSFLKEKGINRATIRVNPKNESSLRIPEKLGFEKTGRIVDENGQVLEIFIKNIEK